MDEALPLEFFKSIMIRRMTIKIFLTKNLVRTADLICLFCRPNRIPFAVDTYANIDRGHMYRKQGGWLCHMSFYAELSTPWFWWGNSKLMIWRFSLVLFNIVWLKGFELELKLTWSAFLTYEWEKLDKVWSCMKMHQWGGLPCYHQKINLNFQQLGCQ